MTFSLVDMAAGINASQTVDQNQIKTQLDRSNLATTSAENLVKQANAKQALDLNTAGATQRQSVMQDMASQTPTTAAPGMDPTATQTLTSAADPGSDIIKYKEVDNLNKKVVDLGKKLQMAQDAQKGFATNKTLYDQYTAQATEIKSQLGDAKKEQATLQKEHLGTLRASAAPLLTDEFKTLTTAEQN